MQSKNFGHRASLQTGHIHSPFICLHNRALSSLFFRWENWGSKRLTPGHTRQRWLRWALTQDCEAQMQPPDQAVRRAPSLSIRPVAQPQSGAPWKMDGMSFSVLAALGLRCLEAAPSRRTTPGSQFARISHPWLTRLPWQHVLCEEERNQEGRKRNPPVLWVWLLAWCSSALREPGEKPTAMAWGSWASSGLRAATFLVPRWPNIFFYQYFSLWQKLGWPWRGNPSPTPPSRPAGSEHTWEGPPVIFLQLHCCCSSPCQEKWVH